MGDERRRVLVVLKSDEDVLQRPRRLGRGETAREDGKELSRIRKAYCDAVFGWPLSSQHACAASPSWIDAWERLSAPSLLEMLLTGYHEMWWGPSPPSASDLDIPSSLSWSCKLAHRTTSSNVDLVSTADATNRAADFFEHLGKPPAHSLLGMPRLRAPIDSSNMSLPTLKPLCRTPLSSITLIEPCREFESHGDCMTWLFFYTPPDATESRPLQQQPMQPASQRRHLTLPLSETHVLHETKAF